MGTSCSSLKKEHKASIDSGPPTIEERRCSNRVIENAGYNESVAKEISRSDASGSTSKDDNDSRKGQISSELHPGRQSSNFNYDNHLCAPSVTPSPLPSSQTPSPYTTPSANKQLSITSSGLPNLGIFSNEIRDLLIGKKIPSPRLPLNKEFIVYLITNNLTRYEPIVNKAIELLRKLSIFKGYEINSFNFDLDSLYIYDDYHQYQEICLDTLKYLQSRAKFIPVIIVEGVSERKLLPRTLDEATFKKIVSHSGDKIKQLFEKWYFKDDNLVPAGYILHPISKHLISFKSHSSEEKKQALNLWYEESKEMANFLTNEKNSHQFEDLLSSILQEEIKYLLSDNTSVNKSALLVRLVQIDFFSKTLGNALTMVEEKIISSRKLLGSSPDSDITDPASEEVLSDFLLENFKKIIEANSEEECSVDSIKKFSEIDTNLFTELVHQNSYRHSLDKHFIGRESLLAQIQSYLSSNSRSPLIIHGPSGCGKSALLGRASFECSYWSPTSVLIYRSIGLTRESLTVEQTLRSICEQCCILYGEHISVASEIAANPKGTLDKLLNKANEERPLVIMIDGVDHFAEPAWIDFEIWLKEELPSFVTVILTMGNAGPFLERFKSRGKSEYLDISNITQNEIERIFDTTLEKKLRKVTDAQKTFASKLMKEKNSPFYAQVLALKMAEVPSNVKPEELSDIDSTETIIISFINQLGELIEPPLMAAIITLISSTKYGLSDMEVMETIMKTQSLRDLIYRGTSYFPYSFWSLIRHKLSRFLLIKHDDQLINFKSHQIKQIIMKYTQKWKDVMKLSQEELLSHFHLPLDDLQPNKLFSGSEALTNQWPNRRKAQEFAYLKINQTDDIAAFCEQYCLNLKWICFKSMSCDPFQILEDLELLKLAWETRSQDLSIKETAECQKYLHDLQLFIYTIKISAYPLRYQGSQIISQIYSRLNSSLGSPTPTNTSSDLAKKFPKVAKIVAECEKPFVPSLLPLNTQFMAIRSNICDDGTIGSDFKADTVPTTGQPNADVGAIEEKHYQYDKMFAIKGDEAHVIALSTGRGEISVWNIYKEKPVRTLQGINQPKDLRMIDQYRAVVLCNRDLRIYNLDEGALVIKLKGVMNQKMPFFGLHNENYLVALSRNRMYVNMQSLKTGDLETTFKVGEDRFLNSLLVSANGNICVCGDETQKPFPLLVWDLINRKLIYDLRIPHHEFITKLSAISDDGHYVVCVSKELNSTSPNFIIVYDLQSGTLFKKWKPDCNTISIAISSSASCVINCVETGLILVWDLSTGAKRLTLQGHIAPVDKLQVDEKGQTLLSYDSTGKDLSIRLWDLDNGSCLAVFTPDQPLSCCQLSPNGKTLVFSLTDSPKLHTLALCHNSSPRDELNKLKQAVYGSNEKEGQEFDLSEDT